MHNPEAVQENETHKILWDYEINTDHLISANASQQKKKRICWIVDLEIKESKKRDKYQDFAREIKKTM